MITVDNWNLTDGVNGDTPGTKTLAMRSVGRFRATVLHVGVDRFKVVTEATNDFGETEENTITFVKFSSALAHADNWLDIMASTEDKRVVS